MGYNSLKRNLGYHLSDSTAAITESIPLFAAFETFGAGMPVEVSLRARLLVIATAFAGMGYVFGGLRDLWRKLVKVDQTSPERKQTIYDSAYGGLFNLILSPPLYLLSGCTEAKQIAIATGISAAIGIVNGAPVGYTIDAFRDFTGLKPSERLPDLIKYRSRKAKLGIAALLVTSSIALTAGIYSLASSMHKPDSLEQRIEKH